MRGGRPMESYIYRGWLSMTDLGITALSANHCSLWMVPRGSLASMGRSW